MSNGEENEFVTQYTDVEENNKLVYEMKTIPKIKKGFSTSKYYSFVFFVLLFILVLLFYL